MAVCISCHAEMAFNAKFCHSCGAASNSAPPGASMAVSPPLQPQMQQQSIVQNVYYNDTGATIDFVGISTSEAANIIASFFSQMGFKVESGTPMQGIYGKGSAVARVAVGGFVTREKYSVQVQQFDVVVRVGLLSAMSGFSGGFIGMSREKTARNSFKQSLGMFLNQLPRR